MKEKDIIAVTSRPVTIDSMKEDLKLLGVLPGDLVIVHSSLSSLGWVCGGPQAAVMGLLASVQTAAAIGTLVMPAHSGEWSDPAEWRHPPVPESWIPIIRENMPAYDPEMTPTRGMGKIPEAFRKFPGTLRSSNPQVSFTANGPMAESILKEHPLTPMMGMDSPLGRLYKNGAKVLLLGVSYDNCTAIHLAEAICPTTRVVKMGTAMLEHGQRVWKWFEDFDYDSDDFMAIGIAFESLHPVSRGNVGNADCRLFDMKSGVDFALTWMLENRKKHTAGIQASPQE